MSAFGPKQTWPRALHTSPFGGKADIAALLSAISLRQCRPVRRRITEPAFGFGAGIAGGKPVPLVQFKFQIVRTDRCARRDLG
jgi:hypothetical protein